MLAFNGLNNKFNLCGHCKSEGITYTGAVAMADGTVDVFYYCGPQCHSKHQMEEDVRREKWLTLQSTSQSSEQLLLV